MDGVFCRLLLMAIPNRYPRRFVITSLMNMRSICAVSRSVIRCELRVLSSPEHTIRTNALYVSDSPSNVLRTNPKRNSSSHTEGSYKHKACSSRTPPRDIEDFSGVWLSLFPRIMCIFRRSYVHLREGASVSRPHHCQQQLFVSNDSIDGCMGNRNAAPHFCNKSDQADNHCTVSSSSFHVSHTSHDDTLSTWMCGNAHLPMSTRTLNITCLVSHSSPQVSDFGQVQRHLRHCPRTSRPSSVCNTDLYVSKQHPSTRIKTFALRWCLSYTSRWTIHTC